MLLNRTKPSNELACESCGKPADVLLKDGSTWCARCHVAALELRYDDKKGRLFR